MVNATYLRNVVIVMLIISPLASAHAKDIWSYCQSVGHSDELNQKLMGNGDERHVREILARKNAMAKHEGYITWRCMNAKVYGCITYNSPSCFKTENTPSTQTVAYCKENPDEKGVPCAAGGCGPTYYWDCKNGKPARRGDVRTDQQGYPLSGAWTQIPR